MLKPWPTKLERAGVKGYISVQTEIFFSLDAFTFNQLVLLNLRFFRHPKIFKKFACVVIKWWYSPFSDLFLFMTRVHVFLPCAFTKLYFKNEFSNKSTLSDAIAVNLKHEMPSKPQQLQINTSRSLRSSLFVWTLGRCSHRCSAVASLHSAPLLMWTQSSAWNARAAPQKYFDLWHPQFYTKINKCSPHFAPLCTEKAVRIIKNAFVVIHFDFSNWFASLSIPSMMDISKWNEWHTTRWYKSETALPSIGNKAVARLFHSQFVSSGKPFLSHETAILKHRKQAHVFHLNC